MQRDADEIKELEAALAQEREAREQLEAALAAEEEARQEFVSLVTHELRVPMTSIKGYTDLLLKGIMGPTNEAQTSFLHTIRSNVERMSKMVAALSDINKIESGKFTLNLEDVLAAEIVDETIAAFQKKIDEKGQTVTQKSADDVAVIADRSRLQQILDAVVGNAHIYTPEGGTITLTAESAPDDASMVHITVQDDGIGILKDEQDQIFEKFFRASDEETREVPGNGLDLHLAKLLTELHDGCIWFESERGVGSTFYIQLPASD